MTSETVYVWIHLPGQSEPMLAARAIREAGGGNPVGRFAYRRQYLDHPAALPIDPVLLPLTEIEVRTTLLTGHFSALLDAAPDAWGRRLLERRFGVLTEYGRLLHLDGGQVGALSFSADPDTPPVGAAPDAGFTDLADLIEAAGAVERGGAVAPELEAWLGAGSSIGGARPKFHVRHRDALWIAKLESLSDPPEVNVPILEAATLALARSCGIEVPEFFLSRVGGRQVLMVKRFDRECVDGRFQRARYVSARTVFHANPDLQRHASVGAYPRLARELSRLCGAPRAQKHQLYLRMVFNALVSNTDDHDLNHGLLATGREFSLAPAFDLVPQRHATRRRYQAMLVGTLSGSLPTRGNLLSACAAFDLREPQAVAIIDETGERIAAGWERALREAGAEQAMVEAVRPMFSGLVVEE